MEAYLPNIGLGIGSDGFCELARRRAGAARATGEVSDQTVSNARARVIADIESHAGTLVCQDLLS
jgi:hypothetical protein